MYSLYNQFTRNVNSLFNKGTKGKLSKLKLNLKLKSMISDNGSLNLKSLENFDFNNVYHNFKTDMRKFEQTQLKHKMFLRMLIEDNQRFSKQYHKNYSTNSRNTKNFKFQSKTFEKFFDNNKANNNNSEVANNLFNKDPLLLSNNQIQSYFMNKIKNNTFDRSALNYVNNLEYNLNKGSTKNKLRVSLAQTKEKMRSFVNEFKANNFKNMKYSIDNMSNEYFNKYLKFENPQKRKMSVLTLANLRLKNDTIKKKEEDRYSEGDDKDNNHNSLPNKNMKSSSGVEKGKGKKEHKLSGQIEDLYNQLSKIKSIVKKHHKRSENGLKILYENLLKIPGKKLSQSIAENKRLLELEKELIYSVNAFSN